MRIDDKMPDPSLWVKGAIKLVVDQDKLLSHYSVIGRLKEAIKLNRRANSSLTLARADLEVIRKAKQRHYKAAKYKMKVNRSMIEGSLTGVYRIPIEFYGGGGGGVAGLAGQNIQAFPNGGEGLRNAVTSDNYGILLKRGLDLMKARVE